MASHHGFALFSPLISPWLNILPCSNIIYRETLRHQGHPGAQGQVWPRQERRLPRADTEEEHPLPDTPGNDSDNDIDNDSDNDNDIDNDNKILAPGSQTKQSQESGDDIQVEPLLLWS